MIAQESLKEFLDIVSSLLIGDFIVYYFTISIFVLVLQKVLKTDIDTDQKLKTNPKILLGLFLIYFAGFLDGLISKILPTENLLVELVYTGFGLVLISYVVEKIIYGSEEKFGSGLISKLFAQLMKKIGLSNIKSLKNKKARLNTYQIAEQSTLALSAQREKFDTFFIYLLVCLVTIKYYFSLDILAGSLVSICSIWLLKDSARIILNYRKSVANNYQNLWVKIVEDEE